MAPAVLCRIRIERFCLYSFLRARKGFTSLQLTKKWAGLGKELFTSADNYIISLKNLSGASPVASALLLAAGLAIDVVYKEAD